MLAQIWTVIVDILAVIGGLCLATSVWLLWLCHRDNKREEEKRKKMEGEGE